jgi:hypothetical protein
MAQRGSNTWQKATKPDAATRLSINVNSLPLPNVTTAVHVAPKEHDTDVYAMYKGISISLRTLEAFGGKHAALLDGDNAFTHKHGKEATWRHDWLVYNAALGFKFPSTWTDILDAYVREKDPEYQLYLRLQRKFNDKQPSQAAHVPSTMKKQLWRNRTNPPSASSTSFSSFKKKQRRDDVAHEASGRASTVNVNFILPTASYLASAAPGARSSNDTDDVSG